MQRRDFLKITGLALLITLGLAPKETQQQKRFKVYEDKGEGYQLVGYKGKTFYETGAFYAPYVPLQMVNANDLGFVKRFGMRNGY